MGDSTFELRQQMFQAVQNLRWRRTSPEPPEGITHVEAHTIMVIAAMTRRGESIRPGLIAKCDRTTPSALSQTLKSLEEKGFIVRERADGDSRGVTVALTEAGRALDDEGRRRHDERIDSLIEFLGEEDAREMVRLIGRFAEFQDACSANGAAGAASDPDESKQGKGGVPCA